MRLLLSSVAALTLVACGGEPETPAPTEPTPTEAADPSPDPTTLPTPAQAQTPAALSLSCGGESFSVAFMENSATMVNDDGSHTELQMMAAGPDAEPGVATYTDGKISFARSGAGDTPGSIRFARGKMAWEDCVVEEAAPPT